MKLPSITRPLLPLKLHYLLHGMGGAPVVPFGSLIARQMGVTAQGMGLILALIPVAGLLVKPILGGIADKFGVKKIILMTVLLSSMLHYYLLQWMPPIPGSPNTHLTCSSPTSFISLSVRDQCLVEKMKHRFNNISVSCHLHCVFPDKLTENSAVVNFPDGAVGIGWEEGYLKRDMELHPYMATDLGSSIQIPVSGLGPCPEPLLLNCHAHSCEYNPELAQIINKSGKGESNQFSSWQYWLFVLVITIATLSFSTGCTFQESICHEVLGQDGQALYGQQRLWASVGWGLMAMVAGYLVDRDSQDSLLFNYSSAFKMMILFWALDLLVISRMRIPEQAGVSRNPWSEVGRLATNIHTLAFLVWCIIVGFGFGSMGLHFWLIEDLGKGASSCAESRNMKLLQGLCLAFNCLGEIPIFFMSGRLLSWLGSSLLMVLVLLVHALRLLYYSVISTPWQVLPIELVQGITVGLFFPTLVTMSAQAAPPGAETTMTTLAFLCFDGLGISLGGWVSGKLYQNLGGSLTYRIFGLLCLLGSLFTAFLQHRIKRDKARGKNACC